MKHLVIILMLLSIIMSTNAYSGDVEVSGQIRYRFEMNNKDFNEDTAGNNSAFLRSRLGLKFDPADDVTAFIQVQDSRISGEERNPDNSKEGTLADGMADRIDFHQAYVTINNLHGHEGMSFSIGRMEVAYGGQRLMGAVGWHNIGRSFDGLKFGMKLGMASIDLFNFKTFEGGALGDSSDSNVYGVHADLDIDPCGTTQVFLFHEQDTPTQTLKRSTLGLYRHGMVGNAMTYEVDAAYQLGTAGVDTAGTDIDVAAMMVGVRFNYSLMDMFASPMITVGYDLVSGDDGSDPLENTAFNTLFATNHKFYGYMDYFLNIPAHTGNLGLTDIVVGLKASPMPDHMVKVDFHIFNTAEDYTLTDSSGSTATDLGTEIDITLARKYNSNVKFVLGASFFTPGDVMKEMKGNEDSASWFYWMAVIKF